MLLKIAGDRARKTVAAAAVLAVVFLLISSFFSKESEKRLRVRKEQELAQKNTELTQVRDQLSQLSQEKSVLESRLQTQLAAVREKFQAEGAERDAALEEYKKSSEVLTAKIDMLEKEKQELVRFINNSNLAVDKLKKQVELLEKEKKDLLQTQKRSEPASFADDRRAAATGADLPGALLPGSNVYDLGKIVIRKSSDQPACVEHVNALWGFVVVGAGQKDGLRKDLVINISRDNRLVAKAIVKKVRDDIASAVTLPEWTREEIRVGDLVSISPTKA